MLSLQSWRQLEGSVLDGKVRLQHLTSVDPVPLFTAEATEGGGVPLTVEFHPEEAGAGPLLERYLEASFFRHPHLRRCLGAGVFPANGTRFTYTILERADATLQAILRQRPLSREEAGELGRQLVDGLAYLHERSIVYCNLHPSTVVQVDGTWKLADYSQMRAEGVGYAAETRRLLALGPGTPPEAFEGLVSPKWDSWGLASLIVTALSGPKPARQGGAGESARRRELPEQFALAAAQCFATDPGKRCGLDQLAEVLREATVHANPAPPVDQPASTLAVSPEMPILAEAPSAPPSNERSWSELVRKARALSGPVLEGSWHGTTSSRKVRRTAALAIAGAVAATLLMAASVSRKPPATRAAPQSATQGQTAPPAARPLSQPAAAVAPAPLPPRARPASDEAQVRAVLDRWVAATRALDEDRLAALYAPMVDQFYRARRVSRDWIRRSRKADFAKVGEVQQFEVANLRTELEGPGQATVAFDKTWSFGGRARQNGKVRSQMRLRKTDGEWRIRGEKDLTVYWVRKGPNSPVS